MAPIIDRPASPAPEARRPPGGFSASRAIVPAEAKISEFISGETRKGRPRAPRTFAEAARLCGVCAGRFVIFVGMRKMRAPGARVRKGNLADESSLSGSGAAIVRFCFLG